jgi:uncharacterized membrane protein
MFSGSLRIATPRLSAIKRLVAQRRQFLDWARGVAVLAMIVWHTADAWLRLDLRSGQGWSLLRFVGGLAAPSFLLLAGAGAALAHRPGAHKPLANELARGLEIVLLGYLMRFQGWLIDASALSKLYLVRAWLPLGIGYALLFASLRTVGSPRARWLAATGLLACGVGFVQVPFVAPGRLSRLLQVDVLQAIGASLVLLAAGERAFRLFERPRLALVLGGLVALATEPVQSVLPGLLPVPIAAYLGKFPPASGAAQPALFPLLPWFSYACVGAALGTLLRTGDEAKLLVRFVVVGALVALCTSESHRIWQWAIATQPWSVHPLRVAYRIGLVAVLLGVAWLWAANDRGRALATYGRASLRIYWVHLMLAYGVLGSPWHKRLHVGEWATLLGLLLVLMWLLAKVRVPRPTARPPALLDEPEPRPATSPR